MHVGGPGDELGLADLAAQLEDIEELEDPELRARVLSILQAYDELHRRALARLLAQVQEAAPELAARLFADPEVRLLYDLYDLPPPDAYAAAAAAIEEVRPYAQSHGGDVELVSVHDGVVRIRLAGSCAGCPASTATLRQWVDARLAERLPGYRGLEVIEAGRPDEPPRRVTSWPGDQPPGETVVPLAEIEEAAPRAEFGVARLADLEEGRLYSCRIGTVPLLLVRQGSEVCAFIDGCAGSPLLIGVGGTLQDGEIRCPWHGCRYDARTGRAIAARGAALPRLPVRLVGGEVRVWIPSSVERQGGAA